MTKGRTVQLVNDVQKSMKQALESAKEEGYPEEIQTNLTNIQGEFERLGASISKSNPTSHH